MSEQIELAPSKSNNNTFPSFSVVSRFYIKDSTFLVVSFQEHDNNDNLPSQQIDSTIAFPFLGHFSCDGNHYAIISTQNTLEDINSDSDRINLLTARELQVAALVALGQSNKQVATRIHISEWTVASHLRRIFIKLNVDSRAAMVYKCASLIERLQKFQDSQNSRF
ncbi:response regulator transcription factor [Phormidesmis sp. 146-35]